MQHACPLIQYAENQYVFSLVMEFPTPNTASVFCKRDERRRAFFQKPHELQGLSQSKKFCTKHGHRRKTWKTFRQNLLIQTFCEAKSIPIYNRPGSTEKIFISERQKAIVPRKILTVPIFFIPHVYNLPQITFYI